MTSGDRARGEAYVALGALVVMWGYTWIVIKLATRDASPYVVAAMRPALGALTLLAALVVMRRSLRPTPVRATAVLGLLQTTGFLLFQTIAVAIGGVGKTAVLVYTMPFWVVLLAWPFLGERITGTRWFALAFAAIGLGFVLAPLSAHAIVAEVLAIASGISWAAGAVWLKRMRARYDVELLPLTAWQMVWGALPLVLVMLALPGEHVRWTTTFVAAMTFMVVVSQAGAWLMWMFVLSRLPAGVAAIASLGTPVLGVAFAAVQLHEIPSATEMIGMALIVGALIVNALPAPARAARVAVATGGRRDPRRAPDRRSG